MFCPQLLHWRGSFRTGDGYRYAAEACVSHHDRCSTRLLLPIGLLAAAALEELKAPQAL